MDARVLEFTKSMLIPFVTFDPATSVNIAFLSLSIDLSGLEMSVSIFIQMSRELLSLSSKEIYVNLKVPITLLCTSLSSMNSNIKSPIKLVLIKFYLNIILDFF